MNTSVFSSFYHSPCLCAIPVLSEGADLEEVVADLVGDYLFTDSAFLERLGEKPGLARRIYNKIKQMYRMATAGSKEARQLEQLKNKFEKMFQAKSDSKADSKTDTKAEKNTTQEGGVRYSFGVTQEDINNYIDSAYSNNNSKDYVKYAEASKRLIEDVSADIDITGYVHALRDNDIRHIRNSHGEGTNEKYPVTQKDLEKIPDVVTNYDKVFFKTNANGAPGLVYVKVGENNVTYYVEAVTEEYHNEKLLVNKQMIKTGIEEIPNLYGLIAAINKKESSSQYLADLQEIRKAYVQDVKENYSNNRITESSEDVNGKLSLSSDSNGRQLTKEQQQYFKDSKVRDGNGNLMVMYHGSPEAFTVFDRSKASLLEGCDAEW